MHYSSLEAKGLQNVIKMTLKNYPKSKIVPSMNLIFILIPGKKNLLQHNPFKL